MKIITIISLFALFTVTGCGNHASDNQSNSNSSTPAASVPAPTPANPGTNTVAPSDNGEMTTPGSGSNTKAPTDANTNAPNPPPGK